MSNGVGNSPGVYMNEVTFNQNATALAGTTVLFVGGATKGPLNKPTLCSTEGSFVQKFGPPLLNDSGGQAAIRYLKKGRRLFYLRVAHSAATSDRDIPGTSGGTAASPATGTITFTGGTNPSDAQTITISDGTTSKVFEFDSTGAFTSGHVGVLIGASAAATMVNLLAAINNSPVQINAVDATLTVPAAALTARAGGTAGNVTITTSASPPYAVTGMAGGANAVAGSGVSVMNAAATSPGSWGQNIAVTFVVPSSVTGAAGSSFDLIVTAPLQPGSVASQVERWVNLSLTPGNARFAPSALANGLADERGASQYVAIDALTTGAPTAGTYALGVSGGTVGTDGISGLTASDYIGTMSGSTATGLQAAANSESLNVTALAVPGVTHQAVVVEGLTVAGNRGDCVYLVDVPFGIDSDDAVSWVEGEQPGGVPNSPSTPLSSDYGFVVGPWIKVYDSYNAQDVWVPPSGDVAGLMALADSAVGPWSPIAGLTYGIVTQAEDLEYSPSQAQRESMVGDGFVNPLVRFVGQGIVLMGDKTLGRDATATGSLAARRTLNYAKTIIRSVINYLVFAPNDPITQSKFEVLCNTPLSQISAGRGIQQYQVVCNASTNPPDGDPKTMYGQLLMQLTPLADKIVLSFATTQDGTSFANSGAAGSGS